MNATNGANTDGGRGMATSIGERATIRAGAVRGCLWRGALWLTLLGAGAGAIYGAAVLVLGSIIENKPGDAAFAPFGFVFGGVYGVAFGIVFGVTVGLVVGLIARRAQKGERRLDHARTVAYASLLPLAGSFLFICVSVSTTSIHPHIVREFIFFELIPFIVACAGAVWVAHALVRWVVVPE